MNPENQANRPDDINPNATAGSEYPEGLSHSGVFGEKPINEYPESLSEALNENYIHPVPDTPELFTDGKLKEEKKSKKGLVAGVIGGLAVLGVGIGAIVGINGNKDNENKNLPPTPEPTVAAPTTPGTIEPTEQPTVVATPTPTDIPTSSFEPTPTPVETTAPSAQETEKSVEYSASDLKAMPLEQFNELSLDNRLILVDSMLEYAKEWQSGDFGEHWEKEKMTDLYKYSPLDIASPDNTLEEIVMQNLYMNQLALTQTADMSTSGTFDPVIAAKALSGVSIDKDFLNGTNNDTVADAVQYQGIVRNMATIGEITAKYPQEIASIDEKQSFKETVVGADGKEYDTATVVYYLDFKEDVGVAFPKGGHIEFSEKYVYHTHETPSGDKQGLWIAYESQSFGKVK